MQVQPPRHAPVLNQAAARALLAIVRADGERQAKQEPQTRSAA
jgi:hypothetical protein